MSNRTSTELNYPTYTYTEDDAKNKLARLVLLNSTDSYPFDSFHAHEYNEIMVFIKGGGNHNINFKNHTVENNSIHLLAAKDLHWLERGGASTGFAVVYKDQFLEKLQVVHPEINFQQQFSNSRVINLKDEDLQQFSFLFNELMAQPETSAYQLQLIGAFITRIASSQYVEAITGKIYDPIISKVIKLIEQHFKTKKSIATYAALVHMAPRTLQSRIKKASGKTTGELIQERTLKEAKKLLSVSAMNINEIAFELGFKEAAHFTNWFKKKAGVLPTLYKHGN